MGVIWLRPIDLVWNECEYPWGWLVAAMEVTAAFPGKKKFRF
jgi:hypothetical protein